MGAPTGFPSRLLRLRAEAQMTQKDLAKASGLSVPQIARYESGTSKPRMTALVKLAKALNVEVSALEDARGEPENIEIVLTTPGSAESTRFVLDQSQYDRVREKAAARGVSFEVMLFSLFEMVLTDQMGKPVDIDHIIREISAEMGQPLPES
ncbi:helix-turn-helix domain-containing protein [Pseudomonas sichuanensis]|uniref:helix-turn-helix domain-containing protein n=1 Tax=Pseudomonas sichuanensis TaxID=2213015 RepID=UPI00215EF7A8|nr:helix-turn-helix transcriptional regulator [Pseudomonas sichuanensis]